METPTKRWSSRQNLGLAHIDWNFMRAMCGVEYILAGDIEDGSDKPKCSVCQELWKERVEHVRETGRDLACPPALG